MTKTCYFCDGFSACFSENNNAENVVTDIGILCTGFSPNPDWLEYERLLKENEELKKELQGLVDTLNTVKTR